MASPERGTEVTVAGGKFQLIVEYTFTNTKIKFRPSVKISDAFSKEQELNIRWQKTDGSWSDHKKKCKSKTTIYISKDKTKWYENGDYSTKIQAILAGKKSEVTLTSNIKPPKASIAVKKNSDYNFTITASGTGKKAVPVNTLTLERKALIDTANWETVATFSLGGATGSYSHDFTDQNTAPGNRYKWRIQASNQAGGSGYTETKNWQYTTPPDVSNVVHARISNAQNTVAWSKSGQAVDRSLITSYRIERSVSGSVWSTIATVAAGSAADQTMTYTDSSAQPDNYYSYRVRPINPAGASRNAYPSDSGTELTYNTPAAPVSVGAVFTSSGNVQLTLDNRPKTATALQIQRTEDGGTTWTDVAEIDETETIATSYLDTVAITGSSVRYRARNLRDDLDASEMYSAWTESLVVSTLQVPSAPTLISPVNGSPVTLDNASVRLSWVHNPNDGTPQSCATIRISVNGSQSDTTIIGSDSYYDLDLSVAGRFNPNDRVTWKVKTAGAHPDMSDWSEAYSFKLYAVPEINITSPENGSTIENLPLELAYTYQDDSGTLKQLTLDILTDGESVYSLDIPVGSGTSGSYTYSLAEYLFENEKSYELMLTALSSTGLQAVNSIGINISYVPVVLQNSFFVDADIDVDTGYVYLQISLDEGESEVDPEDPDAPVYVDSPVDHAYLYRVYGDKRVLLGSVSEGDQIIDRYAPVNVPFDYELLEVATTGEIAIVSMEVTVESEYWYVYWTNDKGDQIARAMWNPSGSVSLNRPERKQVRYSGRKYPVTYDSKAMEEKYSFTAVITDRNELNAFRQMMNDGGQGFWKSADGDVYKADFDFGYSADYTNDTLYWSASLEVARIDSEDL